MCTLCHANQGHVNKGHANRVYANVGHANKGIPDERVGLRESGLHDTEDIQAEYWSINSHASGVWQEAGTIPRVQAQEAKRP